MKVRQQGSNNKEVHNVVHTPVNAKVWSQRQLMALKDNEGGRFWTVKS